MKLRTRCDRPVSMETRDNLDHDRQAAHALMQAMDEVRQAPSFNYVYPSNALEVIENRASELMREWGFDSVEVE